MCYSACSTPNLPNAKNFHLVLFVRIKRDPPVNIFYLFFAKDLHNSESTKLIRWSKIHDKNEAWVTVFSLSARHQESLCELLKKQVLSSSSLSGCPVWLQDSLPPALELGAVLIQLQCEVHPPLPLLSTLDQIAYHMCTLYIAHMAFGDLQLGGL